MEFGAPADKVCPHGVWGERIQGFPVSTVSAFKESSKQFCTGCTMILRIVEELRPRWTLTDLEGKRIRLACECGWFPPPLGITLEEGTEQKGSFTLLCRSPVEPHYTIDSTTYRTHGHPIIGQSLHIAPESGSSAALDRVKQWLSLCVDKDEGCKAPQPEFRPHRLININDASDVSSSLKLYEPQEPVPYACLSYCWGTDLEEVLRTTTRNTLSHYHVIEFEELPKTIRDAVTVCKGLSINNLWVDSICIIQDDVEDWLRESSQMLHIYQNSLVTIYAANSDSCKLGFLGPQSYGSEQWQRRLHTRVPKGFSNSGTELFVRDRTEKDSKIWFPKRPMATVIDRRGWCLQEGILPYRRLYYDGNEMRWECNARTTCECGHASNVASSNLGTLSGLRKASGIGWAGGRLVNFGGSSYYDTAEDWIRVVQDYSLRSLSNSQDKLSAISGIARLMLNAANFFPFTREGKPSSEVYHAGLWASSFLIGLSWTALKVYDSEPRSHTRPEQYRAPTWSWASIDGPVGWTYKSYTDLNLYAIALDASVREVRCQTLSAGDPTGRVISGYALLTGHLVSVKLEQNHDNSWVYHKDLRGPQQYNVTLELKMESSTTQCNLSDERDSSDTDVMSTPSLDNSLDGYFCFQLFSWKDNTGGYCNWAMSRVFPLKPKTFFLVLRRSLGGDTFERIGFGSSDARVDDTKWYEVETETEIQGFPFWEISYKCSLFEGCETKTIKIV